MSSLAELPELVGFFSYSRQDDKYSQGALSGLRTLIQSDLRLQLGRDFRLWQDTAAISEGTLWEDEINRAIAESVFFIPIVTPSSVGSPHCKFEFESFLKREAALGRKDLIFPILYVTVDALETEAQWRQDDLLKIIGARQYLDWRMLRYYEYNLPEVRQKIGKFGQNIAKALHKRWVMPTPSQTQEVSKAAEQREASIVGQVPDPHHVAETSRITEAEAHDKKELEPRRSAGENGRQNGSAQQHGAHESVAAAKPWQQGGPLRSRTAIVVLGVIAVAIVGAFAMWKVQPPAEIPNVPPAPARISPPPVERPPVAAPTPAPVPPPPIERAPVAAPTPAPISPPPIERPPVAAPTPAPVPPPPIERAPVVAPTPAPTPAPYSPPPRPSLLNSSLGRWAVGGPSNCQVPSKFYTLSSSGGNIVWRNGLGSIDVEAIVYSDESEFRTRTVSSIHQSGSGEAPGTSWIYTRTGPDRIQVTPGGRSSFMLARCS